MDVMRILFAAADRDLTSAYAEILRGTFGEVTEAFDGAMAVNAAENGHFDLAVIDQRLPRMRCRSVVSYLYQREIPSIVFTYARVGTKLLMEGIPAVDFLPLPFDPESLIRLSREAVSLFGSDGTLCAADTVFVPGKLRMERLYVTMSEIRFLKAATEGDGAALAGLSAVYADSLNRKFEALGKKGRLRYRSGEGFRLEEQT